MHVITRLLLDEIYLTFEISIRMNANYIKVVDMYGDITIDHSPSFTNTTINQSRLFQCLTQKVM